MRLAACRLVSTCLLAALLWCAPGPGRAAPVELLDADFDDKTPGSTIGTGGADAGEPVSVNPNLMPVVTQIAPGSHVLRVTRGAATSASRLRFGFRDGGDVDDGTARMQFTFTPSARDRFSIVVREADGSALNFLSVNLLPNGSVAASDAAGAIGVAAVSYVAGAALDFDIVFDMDAGTHGVSINGAMLYAGRAHGITAGGVGSLSIGYASSANGDAFDLDDIVASAETRLPETVLDADFDAMTPGQPIAGGGAALAEPSAIDSALATTILDQGGGDRALSVEGQSGLGYSQSLRWQWLDGIEIASGLVEISATLMLEQHDNLTLSVREATGAAQGFLDIHLLSTGGISVGTAAGFLGELASYDALDDHTFGIVFDLDARTVRIRLDDVEILPPSPTGIDERGIGRLYFTVRNNTVNGSAFVLDDLRVDATDASGVPATLAFLQQPGPATPGTPIAPTVTVGVLDAFGATAADGTPVELSVETGPGGTSLGGNTATVETGVAAFPALTVDSVGPISLRARSGHTATDVSDLFLSSQPPQISIDFDATPASGSEVEAGQVIVYRVRVTAQDNPLTAQLTFSTTLAPGLAFLAMDTNPGNFGFAVDGKAVSFVLPAGRAAGVYEATYSVQVAPEASGTLATALVIDGDGDGGDATIACNGCSDMQHQGPSAPIESHIFSSSFEDP